MDLSGLYGVGNTYIYLYISRVVTLVSLVNKRDGVGNDREMLRNVKLFETMLQPVSPV